MLDRVYRNRRPKSACWPTFFCNGRPARQESHMSATLSPATPSTGAVIPMKGIPTTKASAVRLLRAHLLAACLAASVSAPAMAGDPVPSVAACASEADPGKRLACYDRASGRDQGNAPPPAAVAPPPAPLPAPPAAAAAPAPPAAPSSAKVSKHLTARVVSCAMSDARHFGTGV
jgi:hypothetical protein